MGQNIDGCTSLRNLTENIDGQHLRPPVLRSYTTKKNIIATKLSIKSINISRQKTMLYS